MAESPAVAAWAFQSSRGTTTYETLLHEDGTASCSCPGWIYLRAGKPKRECKHARSVEGLGRQMRSHGLTAEVYGGKTLLPDDGLLPVVGGGRVPARTFTVPSPKGTCEYRVTVWTDGEVECDCPAFVHSPKDSRICVHTRTMLKARDAGGSSEEGVWVVPGGPPTPSKAAVARAVAGTSGEVPRRARGLRPMDPMRPVRKFTKDG